MKSFIYTLLILFFFLSIVGILMFHQDPDLVFNKFRYISVEKSIDNMFMIYKTIQNGLLLLSCTCLICLSYLISKK